MGRVSYFSLDLIDGPVTRPDSLKKERRRGVVYGDRGIKDRHVPDQSGNGIHNRRIRFCGSRDPH